MNYHHALYLARLTAEEKFAFLDGGRKFRAYRRRLVRLGIISASSESGGAK